MTIMSVGLGLAAFLGTAVVVEAQHDHGHPKAGEEFSASVQQDERVTLHLRQESEAGLKLTMREHLEALRGIVAALSRQEYDQAAKVAHEELGFPKHHQAMQREAGAAFPPKYHELATAHHQAAEDLATAIPSHDIQRILSHLERTMKACVACHHAFRL